MNTAGLVLASGSPRRHELLSRLGLPFEVVVSGVPEPPAESGADPARYALGLARAKAAEVADRRPDRVVLAADTVVVWEGHILGKPEDAAEALHMLRLLRGRDHLVITAVVVVCGGVRHDGVRTTSVTMHDMPDDDLLAYIRSGEPMDKAGAYAIQGEGAALIAGYRGCYENVVGLPLCLTAELLRECRLMVDPGVIAAVERHAD